jgi:ectoine hydroxylase
VSMDNPRLEHCLTPEERSSFEREGYLLLRNVLPEPHVVELERAVDAIHRRVLDANWDPYTKKPIGPEDVFFLSNVLHRDPAFVKLLDHPRTFPKIWGVLGWNIYCYHSHFLVNPARGGREEGRPLGWHQDSGRVNRDLEGEPRPRLSMKVGFYLSDCSERGRANTWIIPGSHLKNTVEVPQDGTLPEGAMPVLVNRGDALIFDRRLFHAGSPNVSDITRKVVFIGYGYRWMRPKDNMTVTQDMLYFSDPIRKQLLGATTDYNAYFTPNDVDVPLRFFLKEHFGDRFE